jgi:hypothetical protein
MANATELFEDKSVDLTFLESLLTPHKDGCLVDWRAVDVALREVNAIKGVLRDAMTRRQKEIDAVSARYADPIDLLEDVKESIEGMIEGFCEQHASEMSEKPYGDDGSIATKQLPSCRLTIVKEYRTKLKVQYDKSPAQEA